METAKSKGVAGGRKLTEKVTAGVSEGGGRRVLTEQQSQ
jgi:hypothetical protein